MFFCKYKALKAIIKLDNIFLSLKIMKDLKYMAAYAIPLATALSISSRGWLTFSAVLFAFVVIPIAEMIIGKDSHNLSAEEINTKGVQKIFDIMLYLNVPIVFALLYWAFINITSIEYSALELVGLSYSVGILLATNAINVAHELGHRKSLFERTLSKTLYVPCLYMHFYIEHNFGHHLKVGTPEDGATAKYNQSLYSFWFTSVFKQYFDAWKKQGELLKKSGSGFFSIKNDMAWYVLIQLGYLGIVFFLFSYKGLVFAIAVGVISFLFLESINYIEHYGLRRLKTESGRYERVQKVHSWNSNHSIGRIVLYELTRHSDHHYKSSKKYQVLDCFEESPQLPYGYPTSILMSMLPPLWFKIMNPLVPEKMKIS
mgnify:FL=1